jgi:hypothetical protein
MLTVGLHLYLNMTIEGSPFKQISDQDADRSSACAPMFAQSNREKT